MTAVVKFYELRDNRVSTPSVVIRRYGVSSAPVGRRSEYRNSASATAGKE
jgi:hypothetical protein